MSRDCNVNTSFYKHVLCHPANSKSASSFFFKNFIKIKTSSKFTRPWIFLIISLALFAIYFYFYFIYPIVNCFYWQINTYLLTYLMHNVPKWSDAQQRDKYCKMFCVWPFWAIISPFKFTQRHCSEGCLFTSEKTCDVEC